MSIEKVANVVEIAIDKLPYMESLYEQVKDQVDKMQRTIQRLENYSHTLNDEIASAKDLLNSYHVLCEHKRQEAEDLNNEISRLEALVSRFKSNNEEYLKINQRVQEEVRSVLTDGKVLLQFALASVIEAIRRNPGKYNNSLLAHNISSSTGVPTQEPLPLHNEDYKTRILEESHKLYNTLLKESVSTIMDNTAEEFKNSSSQSKLP